MLQLHAKSRLIASANDPQVAFIGDPRAKNFIGLRTNACYVFNKFRTWNILTAIIGRRFSPVNNLSPISKWTKTFRPKYLQFWATVLHITNTHFAAPSLLNVTHLFFPLVFPPQNPRSTEKGKVNCNRQLSLSLQISVCFCNLLVIKRDWRDDANRQRRKRRRNRRQRKQVRHDRRYKAHRHVTAAIDRKRTSATFGHLVNWI